MRFGRNLVGFGFGSSGGAGGGAPAPSIVQTNLILDQNAASLGLADGALVASYTDSKSGFHATIATTNKKPLFVANRNGVAAVFFNGIDNELVYPFFMDALTQGEVFLVIESVLPVGDKENGIWNMGGFGGSPTQPAYPSIYFGATAYREGWGSSQCRSFTPGSSIYARHILNIISTPAEYTIKMNGAIVFTTAANTVEFPISSGGLPIVLGKCFNGYGNPFYGSFYHFRKLIYSAKLSDADRTANHTVLSGLYL